MKIHQYKGSECGTWTKQIKSTLLPGAYSCGKAHFVSSISVQSALEQWHLFSSSANLSKHKEQPTVGPYSNKVKPYMWHE